jgi:uncharacterized protein YcbX
VDARVTRISIAPVKALGLVHPDEVDLRIGGALGDRRFWLVDGDGRLFNGKRHGPVVRIRPEWDETSRRLSLQFPDGVVVTDTVELAEPVEAVLYGRAHPSRRVIGPWREALSSFVGRPLDLLWSELQATDRGVGGGVASLVSRASLEHLRQQAGASTAVDGRRFRMMFEVEGIGAHEEDDWIGSTVRIGDAELLVNGDVGRCVVTSHDPDSGVTDLDTLGTLRGYRPAGRSEPLPFGVYAGVTVPGRVRVGDVVRASVSLDHRRA